MSIHYEALGVIEDGRGHVFEPIKEESLCEQKNIHVVLSGPGVIRGNHCHEKGTETMAVMGPALVAVRDHGDIQEIDVPPGAVYRFIFPPGQSHAVKNLSGEMNVLVAFNTVVHDRQHPDTTADVLLT